VEYNTGCTGALPTTATMPVCPILNMPLLFLE